MAKGLKALPKWALPTLAVAGLLAFLVLRIYRREPFQVQKAQSPQKTMQELSQLAASVLNSNPGLKQFLTTEGFQVAQGQVTPQQIQAAVLNFFQTSPALSTIFKKEGFQDLTATEPTIVPTTTEPTTVPTSMTNVAPPPPSIPGVPPEQAAMVAQLAQTLDTMVYGVVVSASIQDLQKVFGLNAVPPTMPSTPAPEDQLIMMAAPSMFVALNVTDNEFIIKMNNFVNPGSKVDTSAKKELVLFAMFGAVKTDSTSMIALEKAVNKLFGFAAYKKPIFLSATPTMPSPKSLFALNLFNADGSSYYKTAGFTTVDGIYTELYAVLPPIPPDAIEGAKNTVTQVFEIPSGKQLVANDVNSSQAFKLEQPTNIAPYKYFMSFKMSDTYMSRFPFLPTNVLSYPKELDGLMREYYPNARAQLLAQPAPTTTTSVNPSPQPKDLRLIKISGSTYSDLIDGTEVYKAPGFLGIDSKTLMYVGIGAGVLTVGGLAIWAMSSSGSAAAPPPGSYSSMGGARRRRGTPRRR